MSGAHRSGEDSLFDLQGQRKYLTDGEARKVLDAASQTDRRTRLYCRVLYYTGCRCSEGLQLTPRRLDPECCRVIFRTLKRRQTSYRAVPVPRSLLMELVTYARDAGLAADDLIFPWCRQSAWRRVRALMRAAGISGPQSTAKGFRHHFGCRGIQRGLPESLVGRLLGHSDPRSTQIYTFVLSEEERALVTRMWR